MSFFPNGYLSFLAPLIKELSFPPLNSSDTFLKRQLTVCVCVYSCPISMCLLIAYYTMLITVTLLCNRCPILFFFLKNILDPLHFYLNFRATLSISIEKHLGIMIWITLNL